MTAEHENPQTAKLPKFPELTKKNGSPTGTDVIENKRAEKVKYLGSKVPQHQPWPGRAGQNTAGSNGNISAEPTPVAPGATPIATSNPVAGTIGACDTSGAASNVRNGASDPAATKPDTVFGSFAPTAMPNGDSPNYVGLSLSAMMTLIDQSPQGGNNLNAIYNGNTYSNQSLSEAPTYTIQRYLAPGEVVPADSFKCTAETSDYIKTHNGFSQYVVVGANNILEIGYGHQIELDEVIAGTKFDAATIQRYVQSGGADDLTYLSIAEADDLFAVDLAEVEDFLHEAINGSITQGQYDALCSFVFQLGLNKVKTSIVGRDVIDALNIGRIDMAIARLSSNVYLDGMIDPNTVARRRDERELMGTFTDPNIYGEIPITGAPVRIGQFWVDPAVKTAIDDASTVEYVDKFFAYVMVAQLSGFNPTAENPTTGSKGLFKVSPQIASYYGITGMEMDPSSNASAGCKYIKEISREFNTVVGRFPTNPELYTCMLLGGDLGPQYALIYANNPEGTVREAVEMLAPGFTANFKQLFERANGESRTNEEFMAYLTRLFNERYAAMQLS